MKGSDNLFPKVLLDMQTSSPAAPSDEDWKLYAKANGIYARSSNSEVGPFLGGSGLSVGSNSTDVAGQTAIGGTTTYAPAAHWHKGVFAVTSSSSNTLQQPIVNIRPGANIGITASDTDGNGVFDTLTISGQAGGGGGGSASNLAAGKTKTTTGTYTTTSTTAADFDATNHIITITTGARRCLVTATIMVHITSGPGQIFLDVAIDGTNQGGSRGIIGQNHPTDSSIAAMSLIYVTDVLSAASHSFKLRWGTSAGTATAQSSSTYPVIFSVTELYAA